MGGTDAQSEFEEILGVPIQDLMNREHRSLVPPKMVSSWDLGTGALESLQQFGLPVERSDDLMGIVGDFREAEVAQCDGLGDCYLLGRYGSSTITALQGSGQVFALPASPNVHPALVTSHPSGITPTLVNSSVAAFVECAWRWHWALPLLAAEQREAGETEIRYLKSGRSLADLPDPYAKYQELCRLILEQFQRIDPEIATKSTFWTETIVDVW